MREADDVLTSRDKIRLTPADADMILAQLEVEPEAKQALAEAFKQRAELLGEEGQIRNPLARARSREV